MADIVISADTTGVRRIPAGVTHVDTLFIPRFRDGINHPAGSVSGDGPASIISATAETQNQTPDAAIVKTEGYDTGDNMSEWQVGSTGATEPAVLQPLIEKCTIQGYNPNGWTTEGDVNDTPGNNIGRPNKYDGFRGYATGGRIEDVTFFGIPGIALYIKRRGSARNGFMLQHDRLKWILRRINCRRVYAGPELDATDQKALEFEVEGFRDWGVKLHSSVNFGHFHLYGGAGPALWIADQQCQGSEMYLENCPTGLYVAGARASLKGIHCHTNTSYNVRVVTGGGGAMLSDLDLRSSPINISLEVGGCKIRTGAIEVADSGKGIVIAEGDDQRLRDLDIGGFTSAGGDDDFATNGIGIDVTDTINRCTWDGITIADMTTGIDFSGTGAIGNTGSVLIVNFVNCTTNVIWPASGAWTTTPNPAETCDVRINGTRFYRP